MRQTSFNRRIFSFKWSISLALPTKFGQDLNLISNKSNLIKWKSINRSGDIWFECELDKDNLKVIFSTTSEEISDIIKNFKKN